MVVVGVVLALGFALLIDRTKARLEDSIADAAETRALDVATLAEAGALPGTIIASAGEQHVQVVEDGLVVAATFALDLFPPLSDTRPGPGETVRLDLPEAVFESIEEESGLIEDEGPYLLVARGYQVSTGRGTVLVASSIDAAATAVNALRPLLWIGWPVTLAAVGATVWFLTGWALRPVEAMSEEADEISAAALDRRLPVPRADDEIRHLATTLNQMLGRIEAAAVRQRQFVSDASHELKTPIATIRTMVEVAAGDPAFDDWDGMLAGLQRENARMDGLVADLLALARYDEGAPMAVLADVDLDQVLGRVSERIAGAFPAVTVDSSGIGAARVRGDEGALERLFTNLGANAARHATARVALACGVENGWVVARVTDDGPGIPAADRGRVFERFVRLDEARDRPRGGTGLGLAVARAIARTHGGDVRVVDTDRGATLEVMLPAGEQGGFSARS
jgi:signal transduction histidine kinase